MNCKLIGVRDLIRGEIVLVGHARMEAQFVRDTLPVCVQSLRLPIPDIQFVQIGEINLETGEIFPLPQKIIPTDVYKWQTENEAQKTSDSLKRELKNSLDSSKE